MSRLSAWLAASVLAGATMLPVPAAAETYHHCAAFIDTIPTVITTQGVWCLRADLGTSMASGTAITVATNNVTIDCNGYKLGGLGAGASTAAIGIGATDRAVTTVRGCNIRGFHRGVFLDGGHAHRVADNLFDGNTSASIWLSGDASVVRGNIVVDTGGEPGSSAAYGIVVTGSVDVLDNTVDGVWSATADGGAIGLRSFDNGGGSIAGNRVRGLVHAGSGQVIGLSATGNGVLDVSGNVLVGDGGGYGLACSASTGVRFRDNAIREFAQIDVDCIDAGGNDIVP